MDNLIFKKIWQDEDLLELNIIGMCDSVKAHQDCYISKKDLEELANKIAEIYIKHSEFNETSTNILPAPFEEFSIKEIQDLSKRITIMPSNHGHSTDMLINWQGVRRKDDDFSKLCFYYLTYIKFLGCYIERYFNELFRMKSLGINYPDIYTYLSKIISGIEKCIENK